MNLILRPLNDVNDVTWSIIWCLILLLMGVGYYIYTIMTLAFKGLEDGSDDPSKQVRVATTSNVIEINRVVDGDTIDVTIDLGFDLYKKLRVRVARLLIRQRNAIV